MATDTLGQRYAWTPYQNGNNVSITNSHHRSSNKDILKRDTLFRRNGYHTTVPHSSAILAQEVNNNSKTEARGIKHLFEPSCTMKDIQKNNCNPAAAVLKGFESFVEKPSMNGYSERESNGPSRWAKGLMLEEYSRYIGGSRSRGFIQASDMVGRNGFSPPLQFHDRKRILSMHCTEAQEQSFHMKKGSTSPVTFNRSVSSPSFENSYSTFQKPPTRKISEPSRIEMSAKQDLLKLWRTSISEDDFNGLHGPSLITKDYLQIENCGIDNCSPPAGVESRSPEFSIYTADSFADIQKARQRMNDKFARQRRSPGVIGEERYKANYRSRSFEESYNPNRLRVNGDNLRHRSKSFASDGDVKSCNLCKINFPSKQQYGEHLQSTKHLNKIAKVTSEPYSKFCDYCNVGLNSKSQAQEHFSSGRHEQTVAKSQKAPIRDHPQLNTVCEGLDETSLTITKPREYQVELYAKVMSTNSVCFLPTGTGKNLISAMVVAHMLLLNPTRQMIFLVDRVLLVLKQSEHLRRELRNLKIPQSAKDSSGTLFDLHHGQSFRPVRIGAICGEMRKLEPGVPIFEHDVLIVTADCYRNHINNGTLRFEDSGLIVLDESHHCNKDHPYNVIIRDYYRPDDITVFDRPKILGLTASPAGIDH